MADSKIMDNGSYPPGEIMSGVAAYDFLKYPLKIDSF